MKPKLSVLIPIYAPSSYLNDLVQSLLCEPIAKEIILIDDASPQNKQSYFKGLPVRYIRLDQNRGPAHALNIGMSEAQAPLVCFMDQDDLLAQNGLSWRLEWLENNPDQQAVMGDLAGILDTRSQRQSHYGMLLKKRLMTLPEVLGIDFFENGGWVPLCPLPLCLFQKSLLEKVGAFDENLRHAHDREYLYRILKQTEIPRVPRSVLFYRLHDQNASIEIQDGKIYPKKRTIAELYLINAAHQIPFPHANA